MVRKQKRPTMKKFFFLSIILSISLTTISSAQTAKRPNSLSWRWVWNNFQYPISKDLNSSDYTTGAEAAYGRYLNRWLNLSVPLKFGKANLPIDDLGNVDENELIVSLDALLHFNIVKTGSLVQPYLLGGAGLMIEARNNNAEYNAEFPLGIGLNIRVAPGFYISAESQYRLDLNDNRNQLQHAVGIKFEMGNGEDEVTDSDQDGIPDEADRCPNKAGIASLFGCPDADGDGIADQNDDCPFEKGLPDLNGCPDSDGDHVPNHIDDCPDVAGSMSNNGCPVEDKDGDGILDADDRCPEKPGTQLTRGCPDLDGDGVADIDDQCPSQAGLPENKGCPDSDGDGVADPFDKCPNTVGTIANQGCPELEEEEKEVLLFAMKAVEFETGSARLKPVSNEVLKQIAEILGKYPGQKLRISGHTDSIGSPEDNLKLSERRAKACYDYLVKIGVPPSKMTYKGFGESQPIESNMFAPGREKNRRVEFEIYVE